MAVTNNSSSYPVIQGDSDTDIIRKCEQAMSLWYGYFTTNIMNYRLDKRFVYGDQWDASIRSTYIHLEKPCLTVNKVASNVKRVTGEQKNNTVMPLVIPSNDEVSQEEVDLVSGMVKKYCYDSNAKQQYSYAFKDAIEGGWGAFRLYNKYENSHSFEQTLAIEAFKDPLNVFFDVFASKPSKCDGDFCGDSWIMSRESFHQMYPRAKFPPTTILPSSAPLIPMIQADSAVITRFFWRRKKKKTLVELSNEADFKKTCYEEEVPEVQAKYYLEKSQEGMPSFMIPPLIEKNTRPVDVDYIMCYYLTSHEVLERYEWEGKDLPYYFVDGCSTYIDGKQFTKSFIYDARDPQRIYNYTISDAVYGLMLSRKEKIMMTPTQGEGFEEQNKNPDYVKGAFYYNPDPTPGAVAPYQLQPQEIPQSLFVASQTASEDVHKTMGLLEGGLGNLPDKSSGRALERATANQNVALVDYQDNLNNAIEDVGKEILYMLPKIFDTDDRVVSILDENNKVQRVKINTQDEEGNPINRITDAHEKFHGLEIIAGASFEMQKEMERNALLELMSINPSIAPLIIDLLPREMSLTIAPILEKRLKYAVPEYVQNNQPPPPPQPSPEEQQMQAQIQIKQMEAQLKAEELELKKQEMTLKNLNFQHEMNIKEEEAQLEKEKLALQMAEAELDAVKSELSSVTELEKAKIDAHIEKIKALLDLHKVQADLHKHSQKISSAKTLN